MMISIGQLASMLGITTRTLRHYDAIGLFPPDHVGPDNGYRFYRSAQIATLLRILHLRRLDVPLEAICTLQHQGALDDAQAFAAFLRQHREALSREIAERSRLLDDINQLISHIEKGSTMQLTPTLIDLPAFDVDGLTLECEDASAIPALWHSLRVRCAADGRFGKDWIGYGLCMPGNDERFTYVAARAAKPGTTPPDGMQRYTIPAQRYARFTHRGSIAQLPDTFGQAWQSLESVWHLTPATGTQFEYYDARFTDAQDPQAEVDLYIPVSAA